MFKQMKRWFSNLWDYTKAIFLDPQDWKEFRSAIRYFNDVKWVGGMESFNMDTGKAKHAHDQEIFDTYLRCDALTKWHNKKSVVTFKYTVIIIKNIVLGLAFASAVVFGAIYLYKATRRTDAEIRQERYEYIMKHTNDIQIDGCDYIYFFDPDHHAVSITHKGNCKNPIHRKE